MIINLRYDYDYSAIKTQAHMNNNKTEAHKNIPHLNLLRLLLLHKNCVRNQYWYPLVA